jgi:hypothetical protein
MGGNDLGHRLSLRCVREAIKFQQDDPANTEALADDQFAEITILGDQNALLSIRRLENNLGPTSRVGRLRVLENAANAGFSRSRLICGAK